MEPPRRSSRIALRREAALEQQRVGTAAPRAPSLLDNFYLDGAVDYALFPAATTRNNNRGSKPAPQQLQGQAARHKSGAAAAIARAAQSSGLWAKMPDEV